MTTHENANKQRSSLKIPLGYYRQADLLHVKNSQRVTKHPYGFPMLGELPSVAGLLLYPGKREKMVTTTKNAFGPKTCPKVEPKKMLQCSLTLDGERCFRTTHREDFPAYTLEGAPIEWEIKAPVRQKTARVILDRATLYQQDFPAPRGIYIRRNKVTPHPDNLAINPSMRAEYRTVQRETYPGWDVCVHSRPAPARLQRTADADQ